MATNAISDMLRLMKTPAASQRKVVRKDQLHYLKECTHLGCVSQDSYPRKSIFREERKLGSRHAVKFSKGTWLQINRERKGRSARYYPEV